MTAGLRALGGFNLQVLQESAHTPTADEAQAMQLIPGAQCWVREVVMSVDGVECVLGRSLTPDHDPHQNWRPVRSLGSRSLGSLLYEDAAIRRSKFSYCTPNADSRLATLAHQRVHPWPNAGALLARRSIFWREGNPLLVAECFLPSFWAIIHSRHAASAVV